VNTTNSTASTDEATIRALMAEWSEALERKDVDTMMRHYKPDALLFDAVPPYKTQGVQGIKAAWNACLPHFPNRFNSVHRDLTVVVGGNAAFVHGLHHFEVPNEPNHPAGQTWLRITLGFEKVNGQWLVSHEHISVPFNPMNGQTWFIPDPAKLDHPDWGSCK
jgi:uncharacterized protein (TIGR02246 family)